MGNAKLKLNWRYYKPKPPQDASFRMTERTMIKAHLFINGVPLKIGVTMSMFCSDIPIGLV